MKSTGILRKIDELGRIVIPKEIRTSLRINVGEPLEIFVYNNEIVLKKHSAVGGINEIAKVFVDSIKEITDANVIVTDRDRVIAVSKELKGKYLEQNINNNLINIITNRELKIIKGKDNLTIVKDHKEEGNHLIIPIVMNGDYLGLVILVCPDREINTFDEKGANFISKCLSKYLEI